MALGEFELIRRFFDRPAPQLVRGIGDDCAILAPTPGHQWLVSTDMLVEGRHFLSTVNPEALGHKALAVNLSDLAACGATPRAVFLALALPRADADWLEAFARGLFALADAHGVSLAGGDTTAGPLNLCITAMGEAPTGQALLRSGAQVGDAIWVSGTLGDARLALEAFRGTVTLNGEAFAATRERMERPTPRVVLGSALRGLATSAIDVSDGLLGDLGHVLQASGVGALLHVDELPRSQHLVAQAVALQRLCTLTGGDDYELVFTAPAHRADEVLEAGRSSGTSVTRIGTITQDSLLQCVDSLGHPVPPPGASFDHFRSP
jgi:thiamine-monophosphate kinase